MKTKIATHPQGRGRVEVSEKGIKIEINNTWMCATYEDNKKLLAEIMLTYIRWVSFQLTQQIIRNQLQ